MSVNPPSKRPYSLQHSSPRPLLYILKRKFAVLVCKGSGKGPLWVDSYRGVTLTSMVAMVLKFLLLDILEVVFLEADLSISHVNQTVYRKLVSCADVMFVT